MIEELVETQGEEDIDINLSCKGLKAIPRNILKLKNLRKLSLYGNNIVTLPGSLDQLRYLSELDVEGNPLRCIPQLVLRSFDSLWRTIHIRGCNFIPSARDFIFKEKKTKPGLKIRD